jgi:putative addiction module component (TIGR02574 family)
MSTSVTFDSVLTQAKDLPQDARFELAERLWRDESYEDEIGAEQYAEVMRRLEEIRAGTAKTVPGEQVWKEAEELLASLR